MHTAALLCAALVGSLACDRSSINSPETSSPAHGFSGTSTLINPWPDEPAGYSVLTDYGFEDTVPVGRGLPVGSSGWFVADNDLGFVTRIMDSGAPFSPPNV